MRQGFDSPDVYSISFHSGTYDTFMHDTLWACRENFGETPRTLRMLAHWRYLRVPRPGWCKRYPDDLLNVHFDRYWHALRHGRVVWGAIVQANSQLFSPGPHDHPAAVVYSVEDSETVDPNRLRSMAHELYDLKGTQQSDPAQQRIADTLADEMSRPYGIRAPMAICKPYRCRLSTTYFVRKHLPGGYLNAGFMPLVVSEVNPFVAIPLPAAYWPEALIDVWMD